MVNRKLCCPNAVISNYSAINSYHKLWLGTATAIKNKKSKHKHWNTLLHESDLSMVYELSDINIVAINK